METDTNKRVIEINGIKMEVDLRHAKRIDEFRVGSRVKLLKRNYGDTFSVHMGVIASFDEFVQRPSIVVAYIDDSSITTAALKFATINKDTKEFEIAPAYESDLEFSKADILAQMDRAIEVEKVKLYDLEERRRYFLANFGKFFNSEQENIPAVEHTEAQ